MIDPLGRPIAHLTDPLGEVRVYARGALRTLTLGNQVEQTCLDLDHPARLVHAYTQAMLLGLLLTQTPETALLLGLGGGALAQALLVGAPGLALDAVEASPAVVEAARDHLGLPATDRLRIRIGDAQSFLQGAGGAYGLVLLDLYGAEGMDPDQGGAALLSACRERLSTKGILVSNHWSNDFETSRRAHATLDQVFAGRVLHLHVAGGNAIAFAFAEALPGIRRDTLFAKAQALGLRLDLPLQRLARDLWGQNAEAFKRARLLL